MVVGLFLKSLLSFYTQIFPNTNHKSKYLTSLSSLQTKQIQTHQSLPPSMASFAFPTMQLAIILSLSLFLLQGTLGDIICETMPEDLCAFSIASSGKRCLLENYAGKDGKTGYQCRTSEVVVERMAEWIESDQCVQACGVDRGSVGISSDSLMEPQFTAKLCAPACFQKCPNIVDLYFNLAAGEGVFLPNLCEAQRANPHRAMIELMSSGMAAGPVSSDDWASGPVGESVPASSPISNEPGMPYYESAPAPAYF